MAPLEVSAPADGPDVSVIIPHYNDPDNLQTCLRLLQQQTLSAGRIEIIVADNNSRCEPELLARVCQPARLINAPIQGAAEARNAGVAASRAPLLAFIDSDCRPAPGWLEAGLRALERAPLVGGRVDVGVEDPSHPTPTEAFERVFAFNNARYIREERFSVTANMFVARAVFDQVGGFRPGVSEDREWGQRAAAMGHAWHYEPAARLEHPARGNWPELERKWRRLMRESFLLARERPGHPAKWVLRNWLMLASTPLAVARALRSREVDRAADRLKAVAILVRLRLWRFGEAHRLLAARQG